MYIHTHKQLYPTVGGQELVSKAQEQRSRESKKATQVNSCKVVAFEMDCNTLEIKINNSSRRFAQLESQENKQILQFSRPNNFAARRICTYALVQRVQIGFTHKVITTKSTNKPIDKNREAYQCLEREQIQHSATTLIVDPETG